MGIGKSLIKYGFNELFKLGYKDCIICCLKDNKSVGFYECMSGIKVGEEIVEIGNQKLLESIYFYKDIDKLIEMIDI